MIAPETSISRHSDTIIFAGDLHSGHLDCVLATLHDAIDVKRYHGIQLDFSRCTKVFPLFMVGLIASVNARKLDGIAFDLIKPQRDYLARLFSNTNWAHHLCPEAFPPGEFRTATAIPLREFRDASTQQSTVNSIVDSLLCTFPNINRNLLAPFEWSLNEITDNVLNHSESKVGGFAMMTPYRKKGQTLEFIVADKGISIPTTLRHSQPPHTADFALISHSLGEGVTRDPDVGQGNGLFGSHQFCVLSGGSFYVRSGFGSVCCTKTHAKRLKAHKVPFQGTLVSGTISTTDPEILADVLKFRGRKISISDSLELRYTSEDMKEIQVEMRTHESGFGSRESGKMFRDKLWNLCRMGESDRISLDFSDIPIVSSSFADEAIGKFCAEMLESDGFPSIKIFGATSNVSTIISRGIHTRCPKFSEKGSLTFASE